MKEENSLGKLKEKIKKYIRNRSFKGAYVELKGNIIDRLDYIFDEWLEEELNLPESQEMRQ